MTKNEALLKYTYGLDGNEPVPFNKFVALIEDLLNRGCGPDQTLIANSVGLAKIGAGAGWVNITSCANGANDIVHLPAVSECEIGHVVKGVCVATGCEIRVAVVDDDTVAINTNHVTVNEAALAAGSQFEARLSSKLNWTLFNYSSAGAFTAPTPD